MLLLTSGVVFAKEDKKTLHEWLATIPKSRNSTYESQSTLEPVSPSHTIEYINGDTEYVEEENGNKGWYKNDKRHREDGPAEEYKNGYRAWWIDGKLHRDDGPAVEFPNGYQAWYKEGKLHRDDGPAKEFADGSKQFWVEGKLILNLDKDGNEIKVKK